MARKAVWVSVAVAVVVLAGGGGAAWLYLTDAGWAFRVNRTCEGGDASACQLLGDAYLHGLRAPNDVERAIVLLDKACLGGSASACSELATLHLFGDGLRRKPGEAVAFLERACRDDASKGPCGLPISLLSCRRLGQVYARGEGVPRDASRAADFYLRAVANRDAVAAGELAALYQAGEGVPGSEDKAWAGLEDACQAVRSLGLLVEEDGAIHLGVVGTRPQPLAAPEELAERLTDILQARIDKAVLLPSPVVKNGEVDCRRIAAAMEVAQRAGAEPILVVGDLGEYRTAALEACRRVRPEEVERAEAPPMDPLDLGVEGGVPGGVEGGVPGGVIGGVIGGLPDAPPPVQAVRIGGQIREPKKLRDVKAVYPDIARQARVQGVVILEIQISPQGMVTDVKLLRGIPLLDQAAIDAVKQWVYTPTLLNGVPVPVIMTVTVKFTLP